MPGLSDAYKTSLKKFRRFFNIDRQTGALMVIDYAHHEVHEGSYFYVLKSVLDLGAVAAPADAITFTFSTPDSMKYAHWEFWASGSADSRVRLLEGATGAGTIQSSQEIFNKDRNSSQTSTILDIAGTPAAGKVSEGATIATGQSKTLWDEYIPGSSVGQRAGIQLGGPRNEIILKANTTYQLSIYGTNSDPASLGMGWYEHTHAA